MRRGPITRSVRIFSGAWYRFPYDLPDRNRLALAVYILLAVVLVHVIVLVDAVVLVSVKGPGPALVLGSVLLLVLGRGLWRASPKLAIVFILWKEYTQTGSVRGSGQFYEHPHAWIDE